MPVIKKGQKSYKNHKFCHICREKLNEEFNGNKNYRKVSNHCSYMGKYTGAAHSI